MLHKHRQKLYKKIVIGLGITFHLIMMLAFAGSEEALLNRLTDEARATSFENVQDSPNTASVLFDEPSVVERSDSEKKAMIDNVLKQLSTLNEQLKQLNTKAATHTDKSSEENLPTSHKENATDQLAEEVIKDLEIQTAPILQAPQDESPDDVNLTKPINEPLLEGKEHTLESLMKEFHELTTVPDTHDR